VDDCIEHPGHRNANGYGQQWWRGQMRLAHRVAWEKANGPIPDGMCVLHRCDNPPCVNVAHLWLGTRADNNADMRAKGRWRAGDHRGERNANAKLTAVQVAAIRAQLGERSHRSLADEYGVSRALVGLIANRHVW
jgi:hypothetical protein